MGGKKTHKIRGFLSIELMLVLSVMAIFGGISLCVGKRVIDRAKTVTRDAEAQMFIMKLLEYYDLTGKWPIATDHFVSVRAVALELNKVFGEVLEDNPWSPSRENPEEFPNIWVRMDGQPNRWGENVLTELQRLAQRPVPENRIRVFEGVRYFFPRADEQYWVWSTEGDVVNGEDNGDNVGTN